MSLVVENNIVVITGDNCSAAYDLTNAMGYSVEKNVCTIKYPGFNHTFSIDDGQETTLCKYFISRFQKDVIKTFLLNYITEKGEPKIKMIYFEEFDHALSFSKKDKYYIRIKLTTYKPGSTLPIIYTLCMKDELDQQSTLLKLLQAQQRYIEEQ